ncbi:MAG TPA: hypothetical protein VEJ63_00425 [Planctomycetota bacterium]|nr:hypothetical protein [Planctomycetota bacterium]
MFRLAVILTCCASAIAADKLPDSYKEFTPVEARDEEELKRHRGKSAAELAEEIGKPEYSDNNLLIYSRPLRPGFHSYIYIDVYEMKDDKVQVCVRYRKAVGCMIVEPKQPEAPK